MNASTPLDAQRARMARAAALPAPIVHDDARGPVSYGHPDGRPARVAVLPWGAVTVHVAADDGAVLAACWTWTDDDGVQRWAEYADELPASHPDAQPQAVGMRTGAALTVNGRRVRASYWRAEHWGPTHDGRSGASLHWRSGADELTAAGRDAVNGYLDAHWRALVPVQLVALRGVQALAHDVARAAEALEAAHAADAAARAALAAGEAQYAREYPRAAREYGRAVSS